ncbi:DUF262 domain-containing protein [Clostridium botulinum]|uniref:DUF262 domain-containing protein n=1 Tax=Clostridium botulinum TaxID=1491 RepID=UPI00196820FC|nr:DUF262 domain-containing protein [Clostridium botulinum]MBN1075018.1 DUF262 domain-containing protein [Clostridium botulinum]
MQECKESFFSDTEEDFLNEKSEDDNITDVSQLLNANISKNLISMSFDTIIEKFNNFYFVLPKYQRKYVWDQKQIANLALSLIKNIPIPPIYVYQDNDDGTYVILDGQQRIISLFLYYNDLIVKNGKKKDLINFYEITKKHKDSDMTLKEVIDKECSQFKKTRYTIGEDEDCIDITYSDLSKSQKRKLAARYLEVVFLDVKEEGKESIYSNIFNLLNSAGTPLAKQEIRNGVYRSSFYDMIHDLNNNNNWRKLFGAEHEKSKDVELLLRLVALNYYTEIGPDNNVRFKLDENGASIYKGSYNLFLDKYSQEAMKFEENKIYEIKENLENFFAKFKFIDKEALETKGNKTINHLLLESLYVAYIKTDKKLDTITNQLIENIKNNEAYSQTTKTATSNKNNIEGRLTAIYTVMKNV